MELPVLPRPATALPPRPVVGAPSSQPATETGLVEVTSPIQVLGVQAASPLAWNSEGDVLAAASSNHSIFLFQLSGQAFKMSKL